MFDEDVEYDDEHNNGDDDNDDDDDEQVSFFDIYINIFIYIRFLKQRR